MTTTTTTTSGTTVRPTLVSGPTTPGTAADFELFFARRALTRLKARLGHEGLKELFKPDIEESTEQIHAWLEASDGKWQPAVTELRVTGLSAAEFLDYFASVRDEEPKMLSAHPEHFVVAHEEGGLDVVENLGRYVSNFHVTFTGEDEAIADLLPGYEFRMVGHASTPDGHVESHVLHEFRETDDGFDAHLAIYFPAAAPEELIEGHRQHLAVEFTNWITAAARALGRDTESRVPFVAPGQ